MSNRDIWQDFLDRQDPYAKRKREIEKDNEETAKRIAANMAEGFRVQLKLALSGKLDLPNNLVATINGDAAIIRRKP